MIEGWKVKVKLASSRTRKVKVGIKLCKIWLAAEIDKVKSKDYLEVVRKGEGEAKFREATWL